MMNATDRDFLKAMIQHHLDAVRMSNYVLERGTDPAIKRLAKSIIAAQTAEIETMRALQRGG